MRGKRRNSPELPDASAGTPEERRERARQDFTFFRRAYFPHYCLVGGDSRLHEWLDAELPRMADAPEGVRLAIAAPRGEAKSTFVSLFFVLWAVLTGRKHYILIIADALEQAASLLGAVKDELEFNEALKRDFPGGWQGARLERGNGGHAGERQNPGARRGQAYARVAARAAPSGSDCP